MPHSVAELSPLCDAVNDVSNDDAQPLRLADGESWASFAAQVGLTQNLITEMSIANVALGSDGQLRCLEEDSRMFDRMFDGAMSIRSFGGDRLMRNLKTQMM